MIDHNVLKAARTNLKKEAFNPMTPEAQAAAAQQGAAPPPAGAAPPMDPAMMGMDPAAMGGAPPMDPAMMGGAPPMDPAMMGMDPAMMGGDPMAAAPVEDPAAAGTPVTLNLEDLKAVLTEIGAGGGGEEETSKRATNAQIMDELAGLKEIIAALAAAQGIQLPAGEVGMDAGTEPSTEAANPEDIAAVAAEMGGMGAEMPAGDPMSDAMAMGLPPGEMPPGAMPKMAVDAWSSTRASQIAEGTH